MESTLNDFPITGEACCKVISKGYHPSEIWTLKDIETMSNSDAGKLAFLWQETRGKSMEISTKELCDALIFASQVICLDITSTEKSSKQLLIDDGELIEWDNI